MAFSIVHALRTLFSVLGCLMLAYLIYTIFTYDLSLRKELTPWMIATLVDFYINVIALAAWVIYKESNWITAVLWITLLSCFGSVITCLYIVMQLSKYSSQDLFEDTMYSVLVQHQDKDAIEQKRMFSPVVAARVVFGGLGCLMLGILIYTLLTDGSPFRSELLTPWMAFALVDFYINVVPLSVWVVYKERSWMRSLFWIVLLICFGSITTCSYIVLQLFQLSSQRPLYLVLLNSNSRNGFKILTGS